MAIDLFKEINEGEATESMGTTFEGTRTFLLHSNSPGTDREDVVLSYAGLPVAGEAHPASPFSTCRRRTPSRMGQQARGMWRVECSYSNGPLSQREEDRILTANPTARPAVVEQGVVREQVPCLTDRDKKSYRNSAKDAFDPPPSKWRSRPVFRVRKNYSTLPLFYRQLADKINYASFNLAHGINYTFSQGTLQFVPDGSSEQGTDNGVQFLEVRFNIEVMENTRILAKGELIATGDELRSGSEASPDWNPVSGGLVGTRVDTEVIRRSTGWDREIPDAGYYYWDGSGTLADLRDKNRFTALDGTFATIPQFLNGVDGQQYETANYIRFGDYEFGDFSVLSGILS